MKDTEEHIIDSTQGSIVNWKEIWLYRELFYFFTWRDVKVKYKQAVLGLLWVVIQPILMITIFTLFFGRALHLPSEDIPYPVFAFSGVLIWGFFSSALSSSGTSMITNSSIIQKIYFPRIVIPLSAILVSLLDFFVALTVFVVFLVFYPVSVNALKILFYWPLAIIIMFMGTVGLGCLLSALTIKYRDFRFVIPFMIQIGFFLTPIVYPVTVLKIEWIKYLLAINPMTGAISLMRLPFTSQPVDIILISISGASTFLLVIFGLTYFKNTELYFADLA